jgi:hypothetical protein
LGFRAPIGIRFLAPFALVFFIASPAHAQRVPDEFIWFAGTSLFAPFIAIPIKLGILRLTKLEAGCSRLWSISAIEWLLWFPLPFVVLRYGRPSSAPMIVLALFTSVVWVHRTRLANASWRSALFLSLATPVLALLLPLLAFAVTAFLYSPSA